MKYDPGKHHRRSIRLKSYDYSRCGAYFVTICTQGRLCLFGDIVDNAVALKDAGKMVQRTFEEVPEKYPGVQTDVFTVMPNHLHGIIIIENRLSTVSATTDGRPLSLPDIVKRFKSFTTYLYAKGVKEHGWSPFSDRLWQRNYFERVIRGDDEMIKCREYIVNNPRKWDEDEENPINCRLKGNEVNLYGI